MNDFLDYTVAHPLAPQDTHQPLTPAECDELSGLFTSAALPASAMPAEMADGYLTACAIGPVAITPQEWMAAIFGQSRLPICADAQQQHRLLQLLLRRHHDITVITSLARESLAPGQRFTPLIAKVDDKERITPYQLDKNQKRLGNWEYKDWSAGFRRAILAYREWNIVVHNLDYFDLIMPIVLLGEGYNPDKPELQIEQASELPGQLSQSIHDIRDFWLARKNAPAPTPYLREDSKVGRNDPCPCGSGKKHKKCCGA
jgi:uncharacterized protein